MPAGLWLGVGQVADGAGVSDALRPLPDHLVQLGMRRATALNEGLQRRELDGPLWLRPHRGVRVWVGAPPVEIRIRGAAALLPPHAALGGWAAAYRSGVHCLDGQRADGSDLPVPLIIPPPGHLRPRPGLEQWRCQLDPAEVVEVDGLRISAPLRTAFDLARHPPLVEAVVAVDALLQAELVTLPDVAAYLTAHRRWRGVPLARGVLGLADPGAESPQESRMRMIWVQGGLPRPLVNRRVYDLDGNFLGRPDLLDPEAGAVAEYDGALHGDPERRQADYARQERFERAGLIVVRFGPADILRRPAGTLARMRDVRERGLRRDRRRDRWQLLPHLH